MPSGLSSLKSDTEPGGYLQWDEVDTMGCYIESVDSTVSTSAIEGLFMKLKIPKTARGRDEYDATLSNVISWTLTIRVQLEKLARRDAE